MVVIKYLLTYFLIREDVWPEGPETHSLTLNYTVVMMLGELYVITFVASIKLTIDWLRETGRAARLEKEQLESELRFLRAQISPHFFFNTLNNIYSLSLEKSDKTPETIIKLSDLMRYVLYETKDKNQSLRKELVFIQNYLDLEKIRYNENLQLEFRIIGNPKGKKIAPMLLVQFIENAFKHGANQNIRKVRISINIRIEEKFLYFEIRNTKPKNHLHTKEKYAGGIGLLNVEKRLKLRYGEDEYKLDIHEELDEYIVNLKLKLR
jgi:LytS/YehU family sensor histidine kinase